MYPRIGGNCGTDIDSDWRCINQLDMRNPVGTYFMNVRRYVAMNLSFACSLRMGEILGLTWDNVHISEDEIAADNAYVYVDKELTRASKRASETLGEKDIFQSRPA